MACIFFLERSVEIFAGSVSGSFEIIASGANGHRGDDGSKGVNAPPSGDTVSRTSFSNFLCNW